MNTVAVAPGEITVTLRGTPEVEFFGRVIRTALERHEGAKATLRFAVEDLNWLHWDTATTLLVMQLAVTMNSYRDVTLAAVDRVVLQVPPPHYALFERVLAIVQAIATIEQPISLEPCLA